MIFSLDWFAFTFPIGAVGEGDNEYTLSQIVMAFHDHTAHRFLGVVTNGLWVWEPTAGFYDHKIQCPRTLLTISWKGGNSYAYCELSGRSCFLVTKSLSPRDLALASRERATRIDLAVDIETAVSPAEFATSRTIGRYKSETSIKSQSGETFYVGSRSGERMARVYRFAYPHPRHNSLRVETEHKGDVAKSVADQLTRSEFRNVVIMANNAFGWTHPIWDVDKLMIGTIPGKREKTETANRLKWLLEVCLPAIRKAIKDDLLSLEDVIQRHLK